MPGDHYREIQEKHKTARFAWVGQIAPLRVSITNLACLDCVGGVEILSVYGDAATARLAPVG